MKIIIQAFIILHCNGCHIDKQYKYDIINTLKGVDIYARMRLNVAWVRYQLRIIVLVYV